MKGFLTVIIVVLFTTSIHAQGVAINEAGTPADSSSLLDIKSNTKGFLPPRMKMAEMTAIHNGNPAEGLMVYCTDCSPKGVYAFDGSTWIAQTSKTYKTGDTAQGGIVFWVDETAQHGLVAAFTDLPNGNTIPWVNGNFTNTKAVKNGIYGGGYNTDLITENQGNGTYAAILCAQYTGNNYGDWFLPSREELNMLYAQKAIAGQFAAGNYWSSTEFVGQIDSPSYFAWTQNFSNGNKAIANKSTGASVRPVRRF